jgi:hypothetical protein
LAISIIEKKMKINEQNQNPIFQASSKGKNNHVEINMRLSICHGKQQQ